MKKAIILLVLLIAVQLMAQDRSTISVKKSETTNGVVIVTVAQGATQGQAKTAELNCNKGAEACKAPEAGTYLMIRLPKNWGMYDCQNVDLYASSADPATDQKIGEYCLIEK